MAQEIDIVPRNMSRIIKQDLGLSNDQTGQRLTVSFKENRGGESRHLLLLYSKERYNEILFIGEGNFTVEEAFENQNDGVYARSSKEARELAPMIERSDYPASVMVWCDDVTSLRFCGKGVKTAVINYRQNIFKNLVEPLNKILF